MDSYSLTTPWVLVNIILFLLGLAILIKSSDWFVDAAAYIAKHFKVSELVIGLTLVSFGTSLPELATDVYASINGVGAIAIGDIVGSNISNICLVLGLGVVLSGAIPIGKTVLKRDAVIMLLIFFAFVVMCAIGPAFAFGPMEKGLGRIDGIILLVMFVLYLGFLITHKDSLEAEMEGEDDEGAEGDFKHLGTASIFLIAGLVLVFVGAKLLVDNVVWTAEKWGLDKAIVSATIVAFGTSVPELSVTVTSVLKKKNAIALGNIIGSCIFNLVLVLGISSLINPIDITVQMFYVILPLMLLSGIVLAIFMRSGWRLVRAEGIWLLVIYVVFIVYNIFQVKK